MSDEPQNDACDRRRPAQPGDGRCRRQPRAGARGACRGGGAWRRSPGADRALSLRLSARGSGPEAGVAGGLPRGGGGACRGDAGGPGIVVGAPWVDESRSPQQRASPRGRQDRRHPPQGGAAELRRVRRASRLQAGAAPRARRISAASRIGLPVCEDIWLPQVSECLSETGAEILIVPNGSPYWSDKSDQRMQIAVARVVETGLPLLFANQVGGQDELVFDGGSFGLNGDRTLAFQMPQFRTGVALTRWARGDGGWRCVDGPRRRPPSTMAANWQACVLGLRDYVEKNGFKGVVLGLSGGIDSAVCAAMAVDALGKERVRCRHAALPLHGRGRASPTPRNAPGGSACRTTCCRSRRLSKASADIARSALRQPAARHHRGEHPVARARHALMALSNKLGLMLVTTGNKSEVSVGYATIYGDMNGGFNPIKDLYKTEVFRLARFRNRERPGGLSRAAGRGDPGLDHRQGADGGAAREPEGPGFAAALRCARRDPRMPGGEGDAASTTLSRSGTTARRQAGRAAPLPLRIQAPAGGAGREDHAAGISAATAAIRSPTGSATRASSGRG